MVRLDGSDSVGRQASGAGERGPFHRSSYRRFPTGLQEPPSITAVSGYSFRDCRKTAHLALEEVDSSSLVNDQTLVGPKVLYIKDLSAPKSRRRTPTKVSTWLKGECDSPPPGVAGSRPKPEDAERPRRHSHGGPWERGRISRIESDTRDCRIGPSARLTLSSGFGAEISALTSP